MHRIIIWAFRQDYKGIFIISSFDPIYMTIDHRCIQSLSNARSTCKYQSRLVQELDKIIRLLVSRCLIRDKYTHMRHILISDNMAQSLLHRHHNGPKSGTNGIENRIKFWICQGLIDDQYGIHHYGIQAKNTQFPIGIMCGYPYHRPIIS